MLLLWSLAALIWLTVGPVSPAEWYLLGNIWSRYLIGFPGAALAAYGLRRQAAQLIAPLREARIVRMLQLAGLALAGYALASGLIVPPGPYFPANWLNSARLESWFNIPVPIFRSLLGLILTVAIIRILEIFDLEIDRRLSVVEEAQILAAERERLGRDLHDQILQSVYAAGLMLNVARHDPCLVENETVANNLAQAALTLDHAVADIRRHIAELRAQPGSLDLSEGLTQLLHDSALSSMAQVEVKLNVPEAHLLTTRQVRHLLAITGEALSNVARHAQAHHVQLSVQVEGGTLCLSVADDGQGIPPDYVAGYGLRNMHDRARLLAGQLEINSRPGHGTRLELVIPCGKELNHAENNYPGG
jgi:signal transduction histidine kinase